MAQSEKIIISVELRDKGVTTGSKKAKDSIDGLTESAKRLARAEKDLAFQESEEGRQLAALNIKKQLVTKANRELAIATMKTTKATKAGKTQTGLNSAILTEAGRAASDAAYGMQGMANNLGQLLTLMSQHIETKGGFVASMKSLGNSIMGAGGVLIALQLLIAYLPQIEKWFKGISNKVNFLVKSFEKAADSVRGTAGAFEVYTGIIKNAESSQSQYAEATERLNEEFPDFIKSLDEAGISLDEVAQNTDKARIAEDLYRQALVKRAMAQASEDKIKDESAAKLQANIDALTKLRAMGLEFDTVKEFRDELDSIAKFGVVSQKVFESLREKGVTMDEERLNKAKDIAISLDEEIKKRNQNIAILQEFVSISERPTPKPIVTPFDVEMIGVSTVAVEELDTAIRGLNETAEKSTLEKLIDFGEDLESFQETAEKIGGLAKGFIDTEIQAEEAKTVKLNNQLKERLSNENLSADERKKIQAQIAANDTALAKKKNRLAEKQFKIDKALAISGALVNTYSSVMGVMADTKGGFFTRLAAAIPTIAFGLAQVAMISKQKFIPTAVSTPAIGGGGGGTGGGAEPQAPAFNIVGSSNVNQLSDAIAGQGDRPVRTYVVASDVSTAQELDRNIIESASL